MGQEEFSGKIVNVAKLIYGNYGIKKNLLLPFKSVVLPLFLKEKDDLRRKLAAFLYLAAGSLKIGIDFFPLKLNAKIDKWTIF